MAFFRVESIVFRCVVLCGSALLRAVPVVVAGFCWSLECLRMPCLSPLCCLFFSLFLLALPLSHASVCRFKRPHVCNTCARGAGTQGTF